MQRVEFEPMIDNKTLSHRSDPGFRRVPTVALIALLGALAGPAAAGHGSSACVTATEKVLAQEGIAAENIRSITYETRKTANHTLGYIAWVRLHDTRGHFVVDLSPHCTVRQSYWQGRSEP
jgi:hypothetical protein